MKHLLNTLYVMTQGAYVSLDHDTVKVEVDKKTVLQVPLLHLGGIVTVGNVMMSPFLMGRCAEDGLEVVILDWNGRFSCRMTGPTSGNVLLRQAQYEAVRDGERAAMIAKNIIAGKVKNSRQVLLRSARESNDASDAEALHAATERLAGLLHRLKGETDLECIRGLEGEAANIYFLVFDRMVKPEEREPFQMRGRSRRPPLDRINALISFLYTILLNDCVTAVEAVGLDPQMGFVHSLRPGRPSLALDLMEEFRSSVAYDVRTEEKEGQRRLRRVCQVCKNFGQRVQKSVFECQVNEIQYERLKRGIAESENFVFSAGCEEGAR